MDYAKETKPEIIVSELQRIDQISGARGSRAILETEPNNNINRANLITFPFTISVNGTLSSTDTVDWFKFQVTKGDSSGNGATHFAVILSDKNTGPGVYMELFGDNSKPPYPHKLGRSVIHDAGNPGAPGIFDMVSPHDGYMFIKVVPNGLADGNYTLDFNKIQDDNVAFDNDNSFASPRWVDAISGTFMSNVYLDPKWDVHDFYNFTGYENQSLELKLTLPSTADYDLFLYDAQSTKFIASSERLGFGVDEDIDIVLTMNGNYYVRVLVKINGTVNHNNNEGVYAINIRGNVPPLWCNGTQEWYTLNEDDPPISIKGNSIWKDLNKNDQVAYLLWNQSKSGGGGAWEPRVDNNPPVVSRVWYPGEAFKVEIINSGTITLPDESIKITPLENQFGLKEFKLGAKDSDNGLAEHNITIEIIPVNDKPVINNTRQWKRFLPDMLTVRNNKISVDEENDVEIQVTAYDVDGDNLIFSTNTDIFDIDPETGVISFYADYTLIDIHTINITVVDDGTNPDQLDTTLTFTLEIRDSGIDHRPKTNLLLPENNSIIKSLFPNLVWNWTDIDSEADDITYTVYLSSQKEKVLDLAKDALIISKTNRTSYSFSDPPLNDQTWYYWTVIPNDGIFTGICLNGYNRFKIDTKVIAPEVTLVSPGNKSILNYTDVQLKWNKIYDGTEQVTFDLYLGISETELELQEKDYKETSYMLVGLANDHKYYWKVVPKAGNPPNRITGKESPIFEFTVLKSYKPPTVELISPDDRSIFKTNEISLSWKVSYKNPKNVGYELFISNSEIFSTKPEMVLTQTFYKFTAPEHRTYYWKVIPFAGEVPGPESEIRWFKIDTTVVQPIVIPKFPGNNVTLNVTYLELSWTLEYSGAKSKVEYDVYLDNSTSYRPGMMQISDNYKQFFIPVVLDDNKTYYWYVLPSIETDEGFIVGEFQGNISRFKVDESYRPPPEPGFDLRLEPNTLKLPLGNQSVVKIILTNTGNMDLTLDISYDTEPNDILFVNLKTRRTTIRQGTLKMLDMDISAPPGTAPNTGVTITVQAIADGEGLAERKVLIVQIEPDEEPTNPTDNNSDSLWMYIAGIIIVLIIILILLTLFITKRRQKQKEEQKSEEKTTEQRVSVPTSSPYSSPAPVSIGYKPQTVIATHTPSALKATPVQPIKPVMPITPVTPSKISPVKPVSPVKPISAKPVKPLAAVSVGTARPTAKPAKPVSGGNLPRARPATPAKPVTPVKAVPANPISKKE